MPGAPRFDSHGTPGFREFAAVRLDQSGQVRMAGRNQAEGTGEGELPRSGIEQVCAAHDVRDTLPGVVDYHRELVRKETIPASHDHIAACTPLAAHDALDPIVEHVVAVVYPKACGGGPRTFGARATDTGIGADSRDFSAVLERLACAAAFEQSTRSCEHGECIAIGVEASALTDGRSIPLEAAGVESREDTRLGARHDARRIQVFDTQEPALARVARIEVTARGGEQRAQMQIAGRRRRKAPAAARGFWIDCLQR
jgi:hypothetical protein